MPGLYETITRCQEYEKQWTDSRARHCSPSLTFATDITTSALLKRIDTKQPSKHAMECTFRRSCILGCATHLHSSRELLRTDSWYVSACFVAIGLPTVRIWDHANVGCYSWNPLTCLLSRFVPLTEG